MSRLPDEILEENILTRLPVKSISRFRCVSRNWYSLFRNPNFIKSHLNHANLMNKFNILVTDYGVASETSFLYSIDHCYNNVLSSSSSSSSSPFVGHAFKIDYPFMSLGWRPDFLGSCNGLVCMREFPHDICIWNPATREYKRLPRAPVGYPSGVAKGSGCSPAYGFGFDCKNGDYKVLRIASFNEVEISEARIYSLASDSWKELGFLPYCLSFSNGDGILLNGVLHWVAIVDRNGIKSSATVFYDISDETFRDVPLPVDNSNREEHLSSLDLGIWEGKLCLLRRNHMEDPDICRCQNDHIDVWTMMDNKWINHFKITTHVTGVSYKRPFQTLHSGEIIFQGRQTGFHGIGLMAYNPNLQSARALEIHGLPDESDFVVDQTYVETLVPLNSGTYVGKI